MSEKSFEQSLERLKEIVSKLEEGEMALEDSLELFEEGMKLSRHCSNRLEAAEQRIEVLLNSSDESDEEVPYEGTQSE